MTGFYYELSLLFHRKAHNINPNAYVIKVHEKSSQNISDKMNESNRIAPPYAYVTSLICSRCKCFIYDFRIQEKQQEGKDSF